MQLDVSVSVRLSECVGGTHCSARPTPATRTHTHTHLLLQRYGLQPQHSRTRGEHDDAPARVSGCRQPLTQRDVAVVVREWQRLNLPAGAAIKHIDTIITDSHEEEAC
jgi:hypothetical protein